jgi:DNA-binding MarR family transcriptional regulator
VATQFIPKTSAILRIMDATGYGRFIVERKVDELSEKGLIKIIDDPGDMRRKLMSATDMQAVIEALTPKV